MQCDSDKASYRTFARLLLDYEHGHLGHVKTIDVASLYSVDKRTVYRWSLILVELCGMQIDRDGYWLPHPKL